MNDFTRQVNLVHTSPYWPYIVSALTFLGALIINSLVRSYIKTPRTLNTRRGRTYIEAVKNTISLFIFLFAFYYILSILKIDITPIIASAGIAGIIIGIGTRTLVEDLLNGFFLLSQDMIAIGDYVNIGGAWEGTVENMGFRAVQIRNINGTLTTIPNGQVRQVTNYSRRSMQVFIDIPVKADQNIDSIMTKLNKIIADMQKSEDPKIRIFDGSHVFGVKNIQAGNAAVIRVILFTNANNQFTVEQAYKYRALKVFEKEKISLA